MKKYWLKGLAVCTFLCTVIAFPSQARVCFLPSDICDEEARPASDGDQCEKMRIEGNLHKTPQPGKNCAEKRFNHIPGCVLYECTDNKNCRAQGYDLGPTEDKDTYPPNKSKSLYTCSWCLQGVEYYWLCQPKDCLQGYKTKKDAQCADGQEWRADNSIPKVVGGECGKCYELCPDGVCPDEQCPNGYSGSKPSSGCYKCHTVYLDAAKTKACYNCHRMKSDYITATEKDGLGEGCYTFDDTPTDVDPVCYLKGDVTCGTDEWHKTIDLGNGRKKCSCEDCTYEFKADNEMHYTAAGGTKKNNVISTRKCDVVENWDRWSSTSSTVAGCTINKESGELKVTCPPNTTTTKKEATFVLKQTELDGATEHTVTVKVIVDPDTCANPDPAAVAAGGCNMPGYANFNRGPNPKCYETKLASEISCSPGYARFESPAKSIAGQSCYYCVKNTCPTDYTLGDTPNPAAGYDTATTDADNNCYKIKACPEGYSTAYQSVNDCGDKQHPLGWNFSSNGMSGDKVCGLCEAKTCNGYNYKHKCESSPRCADESAQSCGYKDLTTPTSIENVGDTLKYNSNDKECPTSPTDTYIASDPKYQACGCGTNRDSGYRSGDKICYWCEEPNRDCSSRGENYAYSDEQCQCECALTEDDCGDDFKVNTTSCTCEATCTRGDGFKDSPCCEDSDCYNTSEFPLYCYSGKCEECETVSDCSFTATSDRYFTKYRSSKFSEHPLTYMACQKNSSEKTYCYPKFDSHEKPNVVFEKFKTEPNYDGRTECSNGECYYHNPICTTGDGKFGSPCCEDTDCGVDQFPLYCFQLPAIDENGILLDENGRTLSDSSCRECGAPELCKEYDTDISRFKTKYSYASDAAARCATNPSTSTIPCILGYDGVHTIFHVPGHSQKQYKPNFTKACRYGECITYVPEGNDECDSDDGHVKDYRDCGNKGYYLVKYTDAGTPCYKCR